MKSLNLILFLISVFCLSTASAQSIIPEPQSITPASGNFLKSAHYSVNAPKELAKEAQLLQTILDVMPIQAKGKSTVTLQIDTTLTGGPEAYRLEVTPKTIHIRGGSSAGVFYGIETLKQLPDSLGRIPCVTIEDAPRFAYRGLLVDPARYFLPLESLKRYIDAMARYKFNALHLHLTDDQGWRIEIKSYPKLHTIGSARRETDGDGKPHQGYYTQEELRDLVAYAAERHVDLIPEIDVPGHNVATAVAYPGLSCRLIDTLEVRTTPGVSPDLLCAGNDSVFALLEAVIGEVASIFPSKRFHIGGDEAPADRWAECPKCRQRKADLGMKTESELMSYFLGRVGEMVARHGKQPMIWYETDVPAYPAQSTMYAWRMGTTPEILDRTQREGYGVICAPGEHAYLDYPQAPEESPCDWMGTITLRQAYNFDPGYGRPEADQRHILGVEATLWGEYIRDLDHLLYMTYPRALAISEAGWSRMERRSWDRFKQKLPAALQQLRKAGINFRQPTAQDLNP